MTSTTDKKHLRRLGHKLKPVVIIASRGLTNAVNAEIDRALSDHELIKVKFSAGDRAAKKYWVSKFVGLKMRSQFRLWEIFC